MLAGSLTIEHIGWFSAQSLLGDDRRVVGDNV